jgi:predicted metal-dependent hydrolase
MAQFDSRQLGLSFGAAPVPAASRHEFVLEGTPVSYLVKRSARRRGITLTIDEDGLRVAAPWRASQRRIEKLLVEHARWIVRKLAEWRTRRPPPLMWRPGARVMVLGEGVILECDPARAATERTSDRLILPLDPLVDPRTLQARVVAWLRDAAYACFIERSVHYAPELAVTVPSIRLSNAKTRWGTCHPDGRVHFNWRLIQMPLALLDYVVVHELAHLRHPNHSPRFWREVERVLPDYTERRRRLRQEGYRYLVA